MLADSVDRQAPVGAILGAGIEVEVLEIATGEDGVPVAHLAVTAGPEDSDRAGGAFEWDARRALAGDLRSMR
jgi:hypothetical protein